jgi:hypothetical protein
VTPETWSSYAPEYPPGTRVALWHQGYQVWSPIPYRVVSAHLDLLAGADRAWWSYSVQADKTTGRWMQDRAHSPVMPHDLRLWEETTDEV